VKGCQRRAETLRPNPERKHLLEMDNFKVSSKSSYKPGNMTKVAKGPNMRTNTSTEVTYEVGSQNPLCPEPLELMFPFHTEKRPVA